MNSRCPNKTTIRCLLGSEHIESRTCDKGGWLPQGGSKRGGLTGQCKKCSYKPTGISRKKQRSKRSMRYYRLGIDDLHWKGITGLIYRDHALNRPEAALRARQNGAYTESISTGPEFINVPHQRPSCLLLQLASKEPTEPAECRRSTSSLCHRPRDGPLCRSQW